MNNRADTIKTALDGRQFKYLGAYVGEYTCLCGGKGREGLQFEDVATGERVVLGEKCALCYLPSGTLPERKKGRRVQVSQAFLDSWV